MFESAEMIPAAKLERARERLCLIVLIGAFDHQQRGRVEAEVESVVVADLRVAAGTVRRGIAIIDADQETQFAVRGDGGENARALPEDRQVRRSACQPPLSKASPRSR